MTVVSEVLTNMIVDNFLAHNGKTSLNVVVGRSVIALSLSFGVIGLALWVYASYLWFSVSYSHNFALFYTGTVSISIALMIALLSFAAMKYRQNRIKKVREEIVNKIEDFKTLLDQEVGTSIRENPKMSLLIATISGALLEDVRRSENQTLSQVLPVNQLVGKLMG